MSGPSLKFVGTLPARREKKVLSHKGDEFLFKEQALHE